MTDPFSQTAVQSTSFPATIASDNDDWRNFARSALRQIKTMPNADRFFLIDKQAQSPDTYIDAARAAHIDIFNAGCVTQGGKGQPGCQSLGVTLCGFAIDKQAQSFFEAEAFKHSASAALLV